MALMPGFKRLFRLPSSDTLRDIDDELQCHLAMKARDLEEGPLTEAAARDEALSRFGDLEEIRSQCMVLQSSVSRRRSRQSVIDASLQDLRLAIRGLRRSPGFVIVAVVTLALGIGGNTAIFSVLNSVILRPLPYPEPDRLVQMFESNPERAAERGWPTDRIPVSAHNYRDYRELNTVFEDMGWVGWIGNASGVNLTGGDTPLRIVAVSASASLFSTLGVEPLLGRTWLPSEDGFAFEGPRAAVLSHGLWVRQFGADPGVLGRTITVDEWPHTVVGVMPPHFDIPPLELGGVLELRLSGADLYAPLDYNAFGLSRAARQFQVIARLREGVEPERAEEEMNALSVGINEANSDVNRGWSVRLIPLEGLLTRSLGPQIALIMTAVGLVLLIGCANVANLLLARGAARRPEIAIRAALGGGRSRIIRQLLTESLVLATVAGGIGLLLAYSGTRVLIALMPASIPRADAANIDGTVLIFAMLVSLGTGVVFGLVPALRASRADLATAMRGGERPGVGARTRGGMSRLLVTGEVALAVVLLVGAGLLAQNFARLAGADLGFEPTNLIKVSLDLGRPNTYNSKYYTCDMENERPLLWNRCPQDHDAVLRFYGQVVERVMRVPGVRSAAVTDLAPLVDVGGYYPLVIPGTSDPTAPSGDRSGGEVSEKEAEVQLGNTDGRVVGPGFFDTMGLRILSGRDFRAGDPQGWTGVAVVNERLASRAWPGESAVGQRVSFYGGGGWMTVIGVVENAQQHNLSDRLRYDDEGLESRVYHLGSASNMDLMVRTASDPNAFIEPIRAAVLELDPGLPTGAITTLQELAGNSNAAPRFYALVVGVFAGFALLLTAVGLYGLVAFTVGRRTKEIGLRMALGANQSDIRAMAMGRALKSVGLGLALGVAGALALAGVLESFLYGMDAIDPLTYMVVALILAAVAAVASHVPASRASRMNPTEALRYD